MDSIHRHFHPLIAFFLFVYKDVHCCDSKMKAAGCILIEVIHFGVWMKNDIICHWSSIWTLIAWSFILEMGFTEQRLNEN